MLRATPALPVRDVEAAVATYTERLGFEAHHVDQGSFAVLVRDEAEVHLWQAADESWREREDLVQRPVCSGAETFLAGTASCRIEVRDVEALHDELAAAGVLHAVSLAGVTDTEHGTREVNALDEDGNLLTFWASA